MSAIGSLGSPAIITPEQVGISVDASRGVAVPKLRTDLLIEFIICVAVLPPTFYTDHPKPGGYAWVLLLTGFLIYHTLRKEPYAVFCLIMASSPLIALLRGSFMPFDTPSVLLSFALAWALLGTGEFKQFWKKKNLLWLIAFCFMYWLFSWARTQDYSNNIRSLELAFSTALVFVLNDRRSYLSTALVGVGISVIVEGMMLAPYGDRLGLGYVPGMDTGLGNPILLGIPAAFVCLLCLAEQGRWLLLQDHPYWRTLLGLSCGTCLLFSTSRGSWLLCIIGVIILLICDKKARGPIAAAIFVLIVTIMALVNTPQFESVKHYYDNVASSDTSIEKKTTGRSEQWEALPLILQDSPFFGVGPGLGRAASWSYAHKGIIFHSLYLQIGAELGFAGLLVLGFFLFDIIRTDLAHLRAYREIAPFLGIVGFMLMGLSVSAIDMSGGLLLGMGMIGGNSANLWRIRARGFGRVRAIFGAPQSQVSSLKALPSAPKDLETR